LISFQLHPSLLDALRIATAPDALACTAAIFVTSIAFAMNGSHIAIWHDPIHMRVWRTLLRECAILSNNEEREQPNATKQYF
jgi:hypothetical protein